MLNSFRDTDIIAKGLPTISEVDLSNKDLTAQLEYCNILYLIYLYSTKTHYKKSIRLLQKFVKKHMNPFAVMQIWLTCIKFKDQKLLNMNMEVYKRLNTYELNLIRLYKDLKVVETEIKEAIYFNNKCIEIFTKLTQKDYSFTYQSFIIYQKQEYPDIFLEINNKLVYDYSCSTNKDILDTFRDNLLDKFNVNILFLYTYISKMGCILNNCNKKCSDQRDKEIRDLLLNDLYLLKAGEDDRNFILKFYNRRKNLEERISYIEFEDLKPIQVGIKEVVITENSKYVSSRSKYMKQSKVYKDEMYSVIGAEYTKNVRDSLFITTSDNKKSKKKITNRGNCKKTKTNKF